MDSTNPRTPEEIHADHPKPGWYRMRRYRGGPWLPVVIWYHEVNGQATHLVARVSDKMERPEDIWTYCADKPVSAEEAKFAFAHGRWASEPEPIAALSNLPSDPYEALLIEVEEHSKRAKDWLHTHPSGISDQKDADFARHLQVEIQGVSKRADDLHSKEKRPVLDEGKRIDDRYRFRADLAVLNGRLRGFVTNVLKRLAVEQMAAKIKIDGTDAAELAKPKAGGMVGKRVGLATVWRAEIVDYKKVAAYFVGHPDLKAVLSRLANHAVRDAKGAIEIPGVRNIEDQVAR